jgi:hypothetical protein
VLSGGSPGGFYRVGEGAHAPGNARPVVAALMAGRFGLKGVREVGSRSGERRQGGAVVAGRGTTRQGNRR